LIDNNVSRDSLNFFVDDSKRAGVDLVAEVWCEIPTDAALSGGPRNADHDAERQDMNC
jgi:hypothetical protein